MYETEKNKINKESGSRSSHQTFKIVCKPTDEQGPGEAHPNNFSHYIQGERKSQYIMVSERLKIQTKHLA
jgi:hypothetical protein